MRSLRSFIFLPSVLLIAAIGAGCGNDKPGPDPSATSSASSAAGLGSSKARLNLRTPLAPQVKVDPQATKEYRVDVCYFGTTTLRQARDAYLASLGGAEPSEKKLPNFGGMSSPAAPSTTPATTGAPAAPSAKPSAAPAAPTAPTAKAAAPPATAAATAPSTAKAAAPTTSGAPSAKPDIPANPVGSPSGRPDPMTRRPFDIALRAPHERNARACTVAAGLKDVPMGEVDAALATYTPFVVDLAKAIATAMTYYQREEFKKDEFKKGKELHKQLVDGFQKLDEMSDKLGAALEAHRKAHPPDPAKMDEGEKLAAAAFNDARDAFIAASARKPNIAGFKEAAARLEKSLEALKGFSQSHPTDPWGKIMNPSLEAMSKAAKETDGKLTDKGLDGDTLLMVTNSFVAVIEAKYRALSRATNVKAAPAASGAPSAAPEAPKPE